MTKYAGGGVISNIWQILFSAHLLGVTDLANSTLTLHPTVSHKNNRVNGVVHSQSQCLQNKY
jgi:hypothetical protein